MLPVSVLEMWLLLFSWLFGFKVYAFNIYVLAVFVRDKALSAINQPVFPRLVMDALAAIGRMAFRFGVWRLGSLWGKFGFSHDI